MRHLPHALSLLRLVSAPFLGWLILETRFPEALALVCFAGLTDWLDGFIARRFGVTGKVGVVLDPLADKIMLVTLFFASAYVRIIPVWLLILVMVRDLVIVVGALLIRVLREVRQFLPSELGKVSTFFQIAFILAVLMRAVFSSVFLLYLEKIGLFFTTVFTVLSGIGYVRYGVHMVRSKTL